jgi:hypothetical protein
MAVNAPLLEKLHMSRHISRWVKTKRQRRHHPGSSRVWPEVEMLEDRLAPAVFNVNSTADLSIAGGVNPDGTIIGQGSTITLRSAIQAANATAGGNTINLTVPSTYQTTQAGTAGEFDNTAGEFAIFSTNLTTGAALGGVNIVNTSGGTAIVDGGHLNRVFDINPSLQITSVNITSGGMGFTGASGITFSAPTLAGGIQATGTLVVDATGAVIGVNITNPGTGYSTSAPPTFTFTGPGTGAAGNVVLGSPKIAAGFSMTGFTIQNGLAQPGDFSSGTGGGIRDVGNASLVLTNMTVTNNSASADGGGISMENSSTGTDFLGGSTKWKLTLNNSTITNNHAGDAGGGVEEDGSGAVIINPGTVISGNTDINQGAGVYLDGIGNADLAVTVTNGGSGYTSAPIVNFGGPGTGAAGVATISGGVVTGVTITNSGNGYTAAPTVTFVGGGGTGAAATATTVLNQSANLTMTGTIVSGNTASGLVAGVGGGLANAGNGGVNITASTIENNFAATTGGGFSDENNGLGTLTISNSLFLNNSAASSGGGIFFSGTTATISNSSIQGNTTTTTGGGLDASGTTLNVTASTISGNTANTGGGGIEITTTGSGAAGSAISNTTITGNSALNNAGGTTGGGIDAMAAFSGSLALLNDTINGNFADNGGGISWALPVISSSISVQNTIIANNTASTAGPDANSPNTFTDNGGNIIGNTSGNTGFTAPTTQTGVNPKLGPLANNGGPTIGVSTNPSTLQTEALLTGSPGLDKGVAAGAPTTDARGFTRTDTGTGELPDVGAFEFQDTTLAVSITPTTPSVVLTHTAFFTVKVTNTSSNALPADNSTVTVTLPSGLAPTSALTFTIGALAAGQSTSFTVTAAGTAVGPQTVSATVNSPDASPNSVSNSASITVSSPTTLTITGVTTSYTLFTQVETVTAQVTSNGAAVTTGQVAITDNGQTLTVGVNGSGTATATFTFSLFAEQPNAHTVTATYSDGTTFAGSSASFTAPSTLTAYLFQLYYYFLFLGAFGI